MAFERNSSAIYIGDQTRNELSPPSSNGKVFAVSPIREDPNAVSFTQREITEDPSSILIAQATNGLQDGSSTAGFHRHF